MNLRQPVFGQPVQTVPLLHSVFEGVAGYGRLAQFEMRGKFLPPSGLLV